MDDYLHVIKLGRGEGTPGKQACWMTALQAHANGEWTHWADCVDPVINVLCILANDAFDDDAARTAAIMEFGLFRPLGTLGTGADAYARATVFASRLVTKWLPLALCLEPPKSGVSRNPLCDFDTPRDPRHKKVVRALRGAAASGTALPHLLRDILHEHFQDRCAHKIDFMAPAIQYMFSASLTAVSLLSAVSWAALDSDAQLQMAKSCAADLYPVFNVCAAALYYPSAEEFVRDEIIPLLNELIEMGPHEIKERPEPACGVAAFQQLCGAST